MVHEQQSTVVEQYTSKTVILFSEIVKQAINCKYKKTSVNTNKPVRI